MAKCRVIQFSNARKVEWLYRRLLLVLFRRNEVIAKKRTTGSKPRKVYTKKSGVKPIDVKQSGSKITIQQGK